MTRAEAVRRKQDQAIWTVAFCAGQLDAAHGSFSTTAIVRLLAQQGCVIARGDVDALLSTFCQAVEAAPRPLVKPQ